MNIKKGIVRNVISVLFALFLASTNLAAQGKNLSNENREPVEGQPMPYFELDNVHYFNKQKVNLNDFKGKWLILDFWFTGCTACIASFPKMSSLRNKFKDKLEIILVGVVDPATKGMTLEVTKTLFDKITKIKKLDIACAYDLKLQSEWSIYAMPRVFIINPEGVLYSINIGIDLTEEKLDSLIMGHRVEFYNKKKFVDYEPVIDKAVTLYQSSFSKWKNESFLLNPISVYVKGVAENPFVPYIISQSQLKFLYSIAFTDELAPGKDQLSKYYGSFHPEVILEVDDSTNFHVDFAKGILNLFNYVLYLPNAMRTKEKIMEIMKDDLLRSFPYEAKVEKRRMPVWKFFEIDHEEAVSLTKSSPRANYFGDSTFDLSSVGVKMKHMFSKSLSRFVTRWLKLKDPVIDEIKLPEFIDINIDADMTNYEHVRAQLNKYGLDLVKGEMLLDVIVIRDRQK